jgi:hypothetical protein
MVDQATVGVQQVADGSVSSARSDRLGAWIVSEARGRYAELTTRGQVFTLNQVPTTTGIAAGNINLAAAAASTNFALWNPVSSGVNLELLFLFVANTSGTTAAGPITHSTFTSTIPSIASVSTSGTAYASKFGLTTTPAARYAAAAAGTALTGGSALLNVRSSSLAFGTGALTTNYLMPGGEELAGSIVIAPGAGWVPTWISTGSTALPTYGVVWAEIPV